MSTILEHPRAQELLGQTTVSARDVSACARDLTAFLARYLPLFYRDEQRAHADTILRGKLTGLQRKTTEPIATRAGRKRRPLQHFVGAGRWDDDAVRAELRRHVGAELADPQGVLVLDGHGVPKKGEDSCGVARQWCGRPGKVDNCQVGYFLAYVAPRGRVLVDCRLYLPPGRATDPEHRSKTGVPQDIVFAEGWRIALDLIRSSGQELPHGWVVGDDEFGRASALREQLRSDGGALRAGRAVQHLGARPEHAAGAVPAGGPGAAAPVRAGRRPGGPPAQEALAEVPPPGGEKGPREVRALQQWVQTKDEDGCVGPRERLVVIRTCEKEPRTWYTLSNAAKEVPLARVVAARGQQHGVEELFAEGNQEVGLNHYEVRSWVGWGHHVTLSLLALWYLQWQRLRLGGKRAADHGGAGADDLHGVAAAAAAEQSGNRGEGECGAAA